MRKVTLLCNALAVLASVGTALSQGLSTINGAIADSSGALVAGAKITVTEVDTGLPRETVSSSEGLYVLSSLRPTRYALTVESPGFRRFTASGITLQANDTTTINVTPPDSPRRLQRDALRIDSDPVIFEAHVRSSGH